MMMVSSDNDVLLLRTHTVYTLHTYIFYVYMSMREHWGKLFMSMAIMYVSDLPGNVFMCFEEVALEGCLKGVFYFFHPNQFYPTN